MHITRWEELPGRRIEEISDVFDCTDYPIKVIRFAFEDGDVAVFGPSDNPSGALSLYLIKDGKPARAKPIYDLSQFRGLTLTQVTVPFFAKGRFSHRSRNYWVPVLTFSNENDYLLMSDAGGAAYMLQAP